MKPPTTTKAGWRIAEWVEDVGIKRSTFYVLPPERKPKMAYIGDIPIIRETPADYLNRMAQLQAGSTEAA